MRLIVSAAFDPPSTTQLSPHLKVRARLVRSLLTSQFGTLSCRLFYWRLREVIDGSKHTEPPVSLIGQLLFREQCVAPALVSTDHAGSTR